jgi:hypothetical protein
MYKLAVCLLALGVSACTHGVKARFQIESEPQGAVIEHDGITLCDATPCTIELECRKRVLTGTRKKDTIQIKAVPRNNMAWNGHLFSSQKTIWPCAAADGEQKLFFNLKLDTVSPLNRVEINK